MKASSSRCLWVLAAVAWCGFIAATSSTVILPHDFFAWIASHVFTDEVSFRGFTIFWAYSWFVMVKGWHAVEFAILFVLCLAVLDAQSGSRSRGSVAAAFVFSLLFAVLDEYHQTYVPGRGGTWTDVAIDGAGTCAPGMAAWWRRGGKSPPAR
jgi:hypothetical protein